MISHPDIGAVAIGRNEGERLECCLRSLVRETGDASRVVYVDSGSTDASVAMAQGMGVDVVELDTATPFTAARARNVGLDRLVTRHPQVAFVQFIDGDCELVPGYLDQAYQAISVDQKQVAVCGRRRERFPDHTIFNRLCDMEWDTPVGQARSVGGDALFRVAALQAVGGYNPSVIAGEEPELCVRLRQVGGMIQRIDAEMTLHDANIRKLSQWWKRAVRCGHAYAQGKYMHGRADGHCVRQTRSALFWGLIIPVGMILCVAAAIVFQTGWPLIGFALLSLGYPMLAYKVSQYRRGKGDDAGSARLYAVFCVLGKFAEAKGILTFHLNRLLGHKSAIIEYKTSPVEVASR